MSFLSFTEFRKCRSRRLSFLPLPFVFMALVGLSACSHNAKNNQINNPQSMVVSNLDQAAGSVSDSLADLAAIDKATHPVAKVPFVDLQGPRLDQPVDITWNGPIAPLLDRVAKSIGYHLQTYGKTPLIPILIDVDTMGQDVSAKQIVSNADLQAGTRASVMIFPAEQIISLRYMTT